MSSIDKDKLLSKEVIQRVIELNDQLKNTLSILEKVADSGVDIGKSLKTTKDYEDFLKWQKKAKENNKELTESQKQLNSITAQVKREEARLKGEYIEQAKELDKLRKKKKDRINNIKTESGSINALGRELSNLRKVYNNLSEEERNNVDIGGKLLSNIQKLDVKYKDLKKSTGITAVEVGNYKENVKEALEETGLFGGVLGQVQQGFNAAKKGVKSFGVSAKAAIASTGIGLLLIALGSIVTYFTKTEKGAQKLKVIMAGFNAIIKTLIGIVGNFGETLFSAFENPKQAAVDLFNFIKDNLISRFEALIRIAKAMINLEFDTIVDDFILVTTGIENASEKAKGLTDEIKENVKQATNLEKLSQSYRNINREIEINIATLQGQRELQQQIVDDNTIGFNKRKAAIKEVKKLTDEEAKDNQQLAENNLRLINEELTLARRNGEQEQEILDRRKDAKIALIQANNEYLKNVQDNATAERTALRDLFEQELDYTIDIFDNRKTALEKELKNQKLSIPERKKILDQIKEESKRNLEEITALYEEQTGKKIDIERLLKEENIKNLNDIIQNQLQFDEIETNRLREVLIERRNFNSDILEADRELIAEKEKLKQEEDKKNQEEKLIKEEEQKAEQERQIALVQQTSEAIGSILADTGKTAIQKRKEIGKQLLLLLLDELERFVDIQLVKITAASLATLDSISSFGATGIARSLVIGSLVKAAFAVVKSQISGFAKGVENFGGGLAYVGEQGNELITEKDGTTWLSPNSKTLTYLSPGSDVTTHQETQKILSNMPIGNQKIKEHNKSENKLFKKLLLQNAKLEKTIKNKKFVEIINDGSKQHITEYYNNSKIRRYDKFYRGLS